MKYNKITDICFLLILWIIAIIIINPLGDFPITDDFSYTSTVKTLYDTGKFIPNDFTSMTLLSHAWLGYFYSLIFGFSIEKLRLLVASLGFLGIVFFYLTAIELEINRKIILFSSLLIMFNPVFLHFSLSFMTDIPFFCFSFIAIYYFVIVMKQFSYMSWFLGTFFSIVAILTRQVGLFIPLAFLVAYLYKNRVTNKNLFAAIIPVILVLSSYLFYNYWLDINNLTPFLYNNQGVNKLNNNTLFVYILKQLIVNFAFSVLYIALFLFPLLMIFSNKILFKINKFYLFISFLFSCFMLLIIYFAKGQLVPISKSVLDKRNIIGTFQDLTILKLPVQNYFSIILSLFSIIGLTLLMIFIFNLILKLFKELKNKKLGSIIFLILCILLYNGPLLMVSIMDRYFFITVTMFILLITTFYKDYLFRNSNKKTTFLAISLLICYSLNSIVIKHDYMSFNRTRWQIMNAMIKDGIDPLLIGGGFEFYGKHNISYLYQQLDEDYSYEKKIKFFVSVLPDNNMRIIKKYKFYTYFKINNNILYVCEKK